MNNVTSKLIRLVVIVVLGSLFSLAIASGQTPVNHEVKSIKFLVLDSRIIDNVQNARLTLGTVKKHPDNPFAPDDFAFVTHLFDRGSNFHVILFPSGAVITSPGR